MTIYSDTPTELRPVLAKIEHQNCLGLSSWFEVVYFDCDSECGGWRAYSGSRTFGDGEVVVAWRYCCDIDMGCIS